MSNWFERYGIAGSYSLALILGYLKLFDPSLLPTDEKILLALGALFLLPLGYLISVLVQWAVYNVSFKRYHIHEKVIAFLRTEGVAGIPREAEIKTEMQAENWLAMRFRENAEEEWRESRAAFMEWARKRWDVLGINGSLLFSSYVILLLSLITYCKTDSYRLNFNTPGYLAGLIVLLLLILVLHLSRGMMRNQLIEAYRDFFPRYLKAQDLAKRKATDRSSRLRVQKREKVAVAKKNRRK